MSKPDLTRRQARNAARETYAEQYNCDPPRVEGLSVEYDDIDDTWAWSGVVVDEEYGEVEFTMYDHDPDCIYIDW